jgi:hypothetical protein
MNKALIFVILPFFSIIMGLWVWAIIAVCAPSGPTEANYSQVRGGMDVAQVVELLGEGTILCSDNRGMVMMKYTAPDVSIYVVFINGIVYQKTIKQGVAAHDGSFLFPEIEL